jgi:hypothetical protein
VQFSARGTVEQGYQTGADTSLVTQRQFSCDTKYIQVFKQKQSTELETEPSVSDILEKLGVIRRLH